VRWNAHLARLAGIIIALLIGSLFVMVNYIPDKPKADMRTSCPYMGGINRDTGARYDPGSIERPLRASLVKVIQLTDEGELVDRCEWADLLTEIRNYPVQNPRTPKFLLLYVHGWKHDASNEDNDYREFKGLVDQMTKREKATQNAREVIGIFVAWPGVASRVPVIKELTFWGRKRAADRVSQSGTITKLLGAINSVRCQRENPQDYIVGIGHSFGARILYSTTSQWLLYELQMHHPGYWGGSYSVIQGPMDLIVLLNPAFEASTYTALDSVRRQQEIFDFKQQPLLLTVSTSNDKATKVAFPLGQWFDFAWKERQRTTVGNYSPYFTHSLLIGDAVPLRSAVNQEAHEARPSWYDDYCSTKICLKRTENVQPGNPFVLATTNGDVLHGHNGIWRRTFTDWLGGFVAEVDRRQTEAGQRRGHCLPGTAGKSVLVPLTSAQGDMSVN
jgi:hypothetical protein